MKRVVLAPLALLLAACGGAKYQDLESYMKDAERNVTKHLEPLPEVHTYVPFNYSGFTLPDPFKPRKLQVQDPTVAVSTVRQPDMKRARDPLEAFPLESIKMVGALQHRNLTTALVRVDNLIFAVNAGEHLGQNFGLVTSVADGEIKLTEKYQDGTGEWAERALSLQLTEAQEKKK
jgi:type IV pilus assembly protein PilP